VNGTNASGSRSAAPVQPVMQTVPAVPQAISAAQPLAHSAVQPASAVPAAPPAAWTNPGSSTPSLTDAARAHVAAQTAFRASQADASTGLAAALSGTVPQPLRPSPLFEDLAARPVGTTTAVKLFNSADRPAIGEPAHPSAISAPFIAQAAGQQHDEVAGKASGPLPAGQMVWSNPPNVRSAPAVQQPAGPPPALQPAAPQPAASPAAPPAPQPVTAQSAAPQPIPQSAPQIAQAAPQPAPQPVSAPVVQQAFVPHAAADASSPRTAPESVAPNTPSLRGAASMVEPPPSSGRSEEKDVENALAAAENVQVPLAGDADDDWMEAVEGAETA